MKLAYYIKKNSLKDDIRVSRLLDTLRDGGCLLYDVLSRDGLEDGTEALLSIGGDGTFLSAARVAAPAGVPSEMRSPTCTPVSVSGATSPEPSSMMHDVGNNSMASMAKRSHTAKGRWERYFPKSGMQ